MFYRYGILSIASLLTGMSCSHRSVPTSQPVVETGVSQTLAKDRKQTLSQLSYALKFDIPAQKNQPIPASETITFDLAKKQHPAPARLQGRTRSYTVGFS